jgi:hypothetical protein
MFITYHQEVDRKESITSKIYHECLHPRIQEYLEKKGIQQGMYFIQSNNFYTRLYLDNKVRVDIEI